MKKIFILALVLLTFATSCDKKESQVQKTSARGVYDPMTFLSAPLRSEMYEFEGQPDNQQIQIIGHTTMFDTTPEQWYWNPTSTAVDNGTTVIKPNLTPSSGRWLLFYKIPSTAKRQETFSGTTNASGIYTVTFGTAYSVAPNIQANIINATDTQNIRITSISTTGFTVLVRNRTDVIGLLPNYSNVNGALVDVLINQK